MERKFNKEQFVKVMSILHFIINILRIILYIALGVIAIGFIVSMFVDKAYFDFDLSLLDNIDLSINNILYEISGSTLSGVVNIKSIILVGGFALLLNIGFVQYVLTHVKKLIKNIKNDNPFAVQNTLLLKNLAIGYLVASLVLSLVNSWFFAIVMNTLDLVEMTVNFSINTTYLFTGIIIFILAYVFDYGAYLQEEYDSTL